MKFVKGMILGTAIAAGMAIMYNEGMMNKKRIMRKGKEIAKKISCDYDCLNVTTWKECKEIIDSVDEK